MRIYEVIGILVLQCSCGKKFVVNSEVVKRGCQLVCSCGRGSYCTRGSQLDINIRNGVSPTTYTKEDHRHLCQSSAMSLEEYKRMLASVILEGKKYKIANQHKHAVNVKVDTVDYENLYATLRNLGFSKEESICKELNCSTINSSIKMGD